VAVIEMGANHVGENQFLCHIAKPTMGLVTNNGKDHLEGFGSIEGVAKSNSELYYYLLKNNGVAFVNANDEWLMRMARQLVNKVTYAANHQELNTTANYEGYASQLQTNIAFKLANQEEAFSSELSGDYNFDNIMAAVAFGLHLGLTVEQISKGIKEYVPSNNRSQNIKTEFNSLLMDAYNANPSSMELAIKNFASMPHEQKSLILGDMFELGSYAEQEHQNIVSLCEKLGFTNVFLCGENFCLTKNHFNSFRNTSELKQFLALNPLKNQHIFIKGSRSMKLEDLMAVL
jgi:UDP-N-acetylmuramoyl-tripeptide--D-alanyl-D-alanine ligase